LGDRAEGDEDTRDPATHGAPVTNLNSPYDAFLSHSHGDAEWVERLAKRLEDDGQFKIWLDRWVLVPGRSWQQEMARGLDEAGTCVVCVGADTPDGWFREEIERALDLQTKRSSFRVLPLILPGGSRDAVTDFLSLRTWVDFGADQDHERSFHVLCQGIRGLPPGRWPPHDAEGPDQLAQYKKQLMQLQEFEKLGVREEVVVAFQRKILDQWWEDKDR
jgi:hypothetical protein